jgi:hypothetical protein
MEDQAPAGYTAGSVSFNPSFTGLIPARMEETEIPVGLIPATGPLQTLPCQAIREIPLVSLFKEDHAEGFRLADSASLSLCELWHRYLEATAPLFVNKPGEYTNPLIRGSLTRHLLVDDNWACIPCPSSTLPVVGNPRTPVPILTAISEALFST